MESDRRASLNVYLDTVADDELSRRSFMKLLGASLALAGIEGCSRMPVKGILPYVVQPELTPGIAQQYATAMTMDGFATGVLVESHEGRPTKVEGNPEHPASLGAADAFQQASVLDLYDPMRARRIRNGNTAASWQAFANAFAPSALRQRVGARGERMRLLLAPTSSPLVAQMLARLTQLYPAAGIHVYAPASSTQPLVAQYDLSNADVVLSIDDDFLAHGPFHLRYARQFAERRRPESARGGMNRLYVIEPGVTVTGASADHRLAVRPSDIVVLLEQLRAAIEQPGVGESGTQSTRDRFVHAVARDLGAHRGRSVVIAGPRISPELHALVADINQLLGNSGRTVWFNTSPLLFAGQAEHTIDPLMQAMQQGSVDTLVCLDGDPLYAARSGDGDGDGFGSSLKRLREKVYWGLYENETARACNWMLPAAHYLESWGDTRAADGTISIVQPLIQPLFSGKTDTELLAVLLGEANASAYDLVRNAWSRGGHDEESWRTALGRGFVEGSAFSRQLATLPSAPMAMAVATDTRDSLELAFAPDTRVHDGSFAGNAWLQEMPDPITKLTWGNAAQLSANTARRLGVDNGDKLRITVQNDSIEIPALIVPGHADDCISLQFGYGQRAPEGLADGVGVNVFPIWRGAGFAQASNVTRAGGSEALALTQMHFSLEPHTPAHAMSLREFQRATPQPPQRRLSLYPPPSPAGETLGNNQWGMTIDLSACTGCGACVLACQAENNVPVVGPADVRKGREMHWLRIDRYVHASSNDNTGMTHSIAQPMLCQHCEKAPCEYVCPVQATVHSPDGLNEMVYNRCVGTRFCSNNCPYKVRRFNWFNYNSGVGALEAMGKNPDVSVRERGVMEKCTFCVQRIRRAEIKAATDGRALATDEVKTACQQTCPAQAIVFGSLTDPASAVFIGRDGARAYDALGELGTVPRVRYLARVTNPNPELEPNA